MEAYKFEFREGKAILKKRFQFKCWKCGEVYSLYKEADLGQKLSISCPFCGAKADVDFRPYYRRNKTVLRGGGDDGGMTFGEYHLPDVLPTSEV